MFAHDTVTEHFHLNDPTSDTHSIWDHFPAVPTGSAWGFLVFIIIAGAVLLALNNGVHSVTGILQPMIRSTLALSFFLLLAVFVSISG